MNLELGFPKLDSCLFVFCGSEPDYGPVNKDVFPSCPVRPCLSVCLMMGIKTWYTWNHPLYLHRNLKIKDL